MFASTTNVSIRNNLAPIEKSSFFFFPIAFRCLVETFIGSHFIFLMVLKGSYGFTIMFFFLFLCKRFFCPKTSSDHYTHGYNSTSVPFLVDSFGYSVLKKGHILIFLLGVLTWRKKQPTYDGKTAIIYVGLIGYRGNNKKIQLILLRSDSFCVA